MQCDCIKFFLTGNGIDTENQFAACNNGDQELIVWITLFCHVCVLLMEIKSKDLLPRLF